MRAKEFTVTIGDNEILTSRTLVANIAYTYNAEGEMTEKKITPTNGSEMVYTYEQPGEGEDGQPRVTCKVNGKTVTAISKNDAFGRKEFDELQFGGGVVSRRFQYHEGVVTAEHKDAEKVKSVPTTQLVSRIELSDGRTIDYEYDPEERITSVVELDADGAVISSTEYTYDTLGQLMTETRNGEVINIMTYDNYGNILTKNGTSYTYDSVWKDQLVDVCGNTICHDAQGNPICYMGHTLSWEKGRQLAAFDNNTYTYAANGIRTSKTIDGIRHDYLLDGAKILKEVWDNNTLIPLYITNDEMCGIMYNNTAYYFLKNLQGDIIGITDKNGKTVAQYVYDAWGACTVTQDISGCGIASINPFRYRGYYFDQEIGMYYLQSRYYDPSIGRFVNADEFFYMLEDKNYDLYAYCDNNPVSNSDPKGQCGIVEDTGSGMFTEYVFAFNCQQASVYASSLRAAVQLAKRSDDLEIEMAENVISRIVSKFVELATLPVKLLSLKALLFEEVASNAVGFVLENTVYAFHDELNYIANQFDNIVSDVSQPLEMDLLIGRFGSEIIIKNLNTAEVYFTDIITYTCLQFLYEAAYYWAAFAYSRGVSIDYTYQ